jgi:hypothetical protein
MRAAGDIALRIPDNLVVTLEVRTSHPWLLCAHGCSLEALEHMSVLHSKGSLGTQ